MAETDPHRLHTPLPSHELPGPEDAPFRLEPLDADPSVAPENRTTGSGKSPTQRLLSRPVKRFGSIVKPLFGAGKRNSAQEPELTPLSRSVAPVVPSVEEATPGKKAGKSKERPVPTHAEIQHSLSDGRFVRISGMVLVKALPRADEISALASFFAKDEKDVGHLLISRLLSAEAATSGASEAASAPAIDSTASTPPSAERYDMIVPVETHKGGFFTVAGHALPSLPAGQYRIQWRNRNGEILPGEGRLKVLSPDYDGPILTSDIDQTYLESDIHSSRGLLKLLREPVRNKQALPGMVTLLKRLQERHSDGLPMVFLSASPTFFAPVFAARLQLHGLGFDGLLLKPFDAVLKRELSRRNVRGAIRALKEQLSYKLLALFEQRRLYPVRARELLFGDDTEHDAITFQLYRDLLAGTLSMTALADILLKHGIEWYKLEPLLRAARAMLVHQGDVHPTVDVYIRRHRTHAPEAHEPDVTWHSDSMSLAQALAEKGELTLDDVADIRVAQRLDRVR